MKKAHLQCDPCSDSICLVSVSRSPCHEEVKSFFSRWMTLVCTHDGNAISRKGVEHAR